MKITCYVYDHWQPFVRPAGSTRQWMEETPNRFAYRCLPLSMANGHGWEIGSPCGFEAEWNGRNDGSAISLWFDDNTNEHLRPISLFGSGVLTFHIDALFRTEDGWNLWVGGPPNEPKDAIAPLGGLIETDWSPYSFTMNWQFTRAGQRVRFEKGETFCHIFPVPRFAVADAQAEIRSFDDAPELKANYEKWVASRDNFHKYLKEERPQATGEQWQKDYFRGLMPDGSTGCPHHMSKIRAPAFVKDDGTPWAPAGMPAEINKHKPGRATIPANTNKKYVSVGSIKEEAKPSLLPPKDRYSLLRQQQVLGQIGFPPVDTASDSSEKSGAAIFNRPKK